MRFQFPLAGAFRMSPALREERHLKGGGVGRVWLETWHASNLRQLRSKWENCMVKVPRPWVADRRAVE